eukprot:SAG31_NODE_5345_length_2595_cov_1.212340_2_plen_550_part_01
MKNDDENAGRATTLPRVFYINDHHGLKDHVEHDCDPDNEQSLIHLLFHADHFQWEGIVGEGGTNCGGLPRGQNTDIILRVLDAYSTDYSTLQGHVPSFPSPASLRAVVWQGVNNSDTTGVPARATAASDALVAAARRSDPRPLWVVTGGSLSDVSRALHDAPDILPKIRVYSIGSTNTRHDPHSRAHIHSAYPTLWWIENNSTFRGVYTGGNQSGRYSDSTFVTEYLAHGGAMGALYQERKKTMKEGDAPMMLYLMGGGDPAHPTAEHWGGQFQLVAEPSFWSDNPANDGQHRQTNGSESISKWRMSYLDLWLERVDWLRNASAPAWLRTTSNHAACSSDLDCRLNGHCTAGICRCSPSWIGADCSQLNLQDASPTADLRLPNISTWGMGTIFTAGEYHGYFAEMEANCGLTSWETNSLIAHAVAASPDGPWRRVGKVTSVWAHNPAAVVAPDKTLLIFHIGTGQYNSNNPERNTSRQNNQTCHGGASPCGMMKRHLCNGSRPNHQPSLLLQQQSHPAADTSTTTAATTISFLTSRDPAGPWKTFEANVT